MEGLEKDRWQKWLKMLFLLPFTDRSLRILPPEFKFRDPVLSLVEKSRRKGQDLVLMLFCPDEKYSTYPFPPIPITREVRVLFSEVLGMHFTAQEIVGVQRFGEEDFSVLLTPRTPVLHDELNLKMHAVKQELERRLADMAGARWDPKLQMLSGWAIIDPFPLGTREAVLSAFRCSLAVATKKLPPNFAVYRQRLSHILNTEDISVLTQPIMSLQTGELLGWEVLTRGPENSPFHYPDNLFEFAYQAGLLVPMECLVFKKAFREISERKIKEKVFINITAVTLAQPFLLTQLLEWLGRYGNTSPEQIVLEITERHSISDFAHMAQVMKSFRKHGFRFAIDDAGAGYASLQTISELAPDIIKIDKSVIQDIDRLYVKQSLLKALLYFAENIQCQVIAEGVEREEEADLLCRNQVHMGQGYYFSRPQPVEFDYGTSHFSDLKEKIVSLNQPGTYSSSEYR